MAKKLTPAQIDQYRRDGYVSPVEAIAPAAASRYLALLEAEERRLGGKIEGALRSKNYLYLEFMDALVRESAVLDAVEDLIGPDILVLHSTIWIKEAGSPARVSWHQDWTIFDLEPDIYVKAWIALAPSTREVGCVQVLRGSHRDGRRAHRLGDRENNLLTLGMNCDVNLVATPPVHLELAPGQMSLHDTFTVHGSGPNCGSGRRIGLGVSYVPPQVRPTGGVRLSAMLVRGTDRYAHFDLEPRAEATRGERGLAVHGDAMARYARARARFAERQESPAQA